MTPRLTALRALEAAVVETRPRTTVESLTGAALPEGLSAIDAAFAISFLGAACSGDPTAAFAAKAALVPGWRLVLANWGPWIATLIAPQERLAALPPTNVGGAIGASDDPARAMALAIIRAMIWEVENA